MGLRVNTNTAALHTQFHLRNNSSEMTKVLERLSSGQRISKASDDVVGMANSESMKASIRALKQAERNAQDGMTLTQVAEGSLNQVASMLVRLRELAIQTASDTVGPKEKELINREFTETLSEIDRVAESTEFNGTKLLAGVGDAVDFQINTGNSDIIDRISFDPLSAAATVDAMGLTDIEVTTKENSHEALARLDEAIKRVSELRSNLGAVQSRLSSATDGIMSKIENLTIANSRIRDTDVAIESAELAKKNTMLQAGTSVLAQANQQPGQALALLSKG